MSVFVDYLIIFWGFFMIAIMAIGGYFMFRKFLKRLPKKDGKSTMDWETYYVNITKHMWDEEEKQLLEELVSPVPELFRDVARHKIVGKVGEVALAKSKQKITQDVLIEGYIIATPKRDHKFLRKKLAEKEIDTAPYEPFFQQSNNDYNSDWKRKHQL
ncbi:DUF2621 family protein [Virgibacillus chiguensis]|uniref:DUF2621 domain-containing protein n=1 Tax=Virgibacillus chiguensis TaxID=411959 RepID=A0A1M5L6G1_9BACI|nr:DUF2621 family protein [Virgibacillus chiguensis]SHG60607.1 Protein of unknown function [Virgibacillus chiguensis]